VRTFGQPTAIKVVQATIFLKGASMTHPKHDQVDALSGLLDDSDLVPTLDPTVVLASPVSAFNNTLTTLDDPPGGGSTPVLDIVYKLPPFSIDLGAEGNGINDYNKIVGTYFDTNDWAHGFSYNNGHIKTLNYPALGVTATYANGINDKGWIVGTYNIGSLEQGFFLKNGIYSTISIPGADSTQVYGINNKGQMVGDYLSNGVTWGFVGYEGNLGYNYTPIDFPGATGTIATCINGKGAIGGEYFVGFVTHGFVLVGGTYTTVDDPNYADNYVTGINNKGWVAGIGIDSNGLGHSWIEYGGNFYTVKDPASTGGTEVGGINNYNHVVGTILHGTTTEVFGAHLALFF
jgi:hypothetical protein